MVFITYLLLYDNAIHSRMRNVSYIFVSTLLYYLFIVVIIQFKYCSSIFRIIILLLLYCRNSVVQIFFSDRILSQNIRIIYILLSSTRGKNSKLAGRGNTVARNCIAVGCWYIDKWGVKIKCSLGQEEVGTIKILIDFLTTFSF